MDIRNRSNTARKGAVSLQMLVILVPVLFAFMGFAVDLGRLYMVRGELKANEPKCIGLVGSRTCTSLGKRWAERMARDFVQAGWTVVGVAPSDFPDMARRLVELGIDSISLNPDTVVSTAAVVAAAERDLTAPSLIS